MASIFTKIIKGEIPSYKVAENDEFYAFLDIRPVAKGHTLVVPKIEIDVFFDLPEDLLSGMMPFCKKVAAAIKVVVPCNRIGITVLGLEVPHAHLHLIPISALGDMNFQKPAVSLTQDEMTELAQSIYTNFLNFNP
jgi:histidine triad (HIT) family protein